MIQDSNAPSDMQPWIRQTESEIDELKNVIERLSVQLQNAGIGSDVKLNAGLDNTFDFINKEDGTISTEAGSVNFVGEIKSTESVTVDKSITVGERLEFIEGEEGLEAAGSAPYFRMTPGSFDINPVTEKDFYSPGEFLINDTSVNMNTYGQISGNGLAITLSNQSLVSGYRADVLDVTSGVIYQQGSDWVEGDPEDEIPVTIYEVAPTDENIQIIAAGEYVNISGCDPEELNDTNALIVEIDLSPGVYLKFKTLKDSSTITYVAAGEVSSNKPNEVYESAVSVLGPAGTNESFGSKLSKDGVFVGPNGGNENQAVVALTSDGLVAETIKVSDTKIYVQSFEPPTPEDGALWIDPRNSAFQVPDPPAPPVDLAGLVLIKTQEIGTAAATVVVDDAFSADYDDYKITLSGGTSSATLVISLQLGTAATSYHGSLLYANYGTSSPLGATVNNASRFTYAGAGSSVIGQMMNVELMSPFLEARTFISASVARPSTANYAGHFTGFYNGNGSFTSFTLGTNTGTMTGGTIRVYGYRK